MKKNMNLYKKYLEDSAKRRSMGATGTSIVILAVLALLMGAYYASLLIERSLINGEVNAHMSYITNPTNTEQFAEANAIAAENQELGILIEALEEVNQTFLDKNTLNSQILSEIKVAAPSGLIIDNLVINESHVVIEYHSKNQSDSAQFIENLKERPIFKSVNYGGYTKEDDVYRGSTTAILRGSY